SKIVPTSIAGGHRSRCTRRCGRWQGWFAAGLVADQTIGLGGRHGARDLFCLHVFRNARETAGRAVAVSFANPERSSRSGGEPERYDLDVPIEGGSRDGPLGGGFAISPIGIRREVIFPCKSAPVCCLA